MRRLYLMRHAKSSWDEPDVIDFARPLNQRGRREAGTMGDLIATRLSIPDLVYCSGARRTCETFMRMSRKWPAWPTLEVRRALYGCDPVRWHTLLRRLPKRARTVLCMGHMPEMAALAERLVAGGGAPAHFPTAAILVLEGEDWPQAAPTMRIVGFHTPRGHESAA